MPTLYFSTELKGRLAWIGVDFFLLESVTAAAAEEQAREADGVRNVAAEEADRKVAVEEVDRLEEDGTEAEEDARRFLIGGVMVESQKGCPKRAWVLYAEQPDDNNRNET
jgi:hypothetical protein